MFVRRSCFAAIAVTLGWVVAPLAAQCTIDFEGYAVNTAITTQYAGVTFSVVPQTCGGTPVQYMRIQTLAEGTSSGTKCLRIDGGCPDFSDDYLRMVFTNLQKEVSFDLGDWATTYAIRYYSTSSGATGLLGTQNVVLLPGSGGNVGVHRRVTVSYATAAIRRIEVQASVSAWESIDDLSFDQDTTPPIAEMSVPTSLTCECDNSVSVRGRACDDDGAYERDTLEYMPVGGSAWTLIGSATVEQCTPNDILYYWNTAGLANGQYLLKLTVYNRCELSNQAVVLLSIHRDLADPVIRRPAPGEVVGGVVCVDGTAHDSTGCNDHWTTLWRPTAGGTYAPVDPNTPEYAGTVINDPLGQWDTLAAPKPADGNYRIQVASYDACGVGTNTDFVDFVLDNKPPAASISSPTACSNLDGVVEIRGSVNDTHLSHWSLQYTGGSSGAYAHKWFTIAEGATAVSNNVLGTWDTSGLTACTYTLRLLAYDAVNVNCTGVGHQTEYTVAVRVRSAPVSCPGDVNADGWVDWRDIDPFVALMNTPCP